MYCILAFFELTIHRFFRLNKQTPIYLSAFHFYCNSMTFPLMQKLYRNAARRQGEMERKYKETRTQSRKRLAENQDGRNWMLLMVILRTNPDVGMVVIFQGIKANCEARLYLLPNAIAPIDTLLHMSAELQQQQAAEQRGTCCDWSLRYFTWNRSRKTGPFCHHKKNSWDTY